MVVDRNGRFEVDLFTHEGKKVCSAYWINSLPTSEEYRRIERIANSLSLRALPYPTAADSREILKIVVDLLGPNLMLKERFEPLKDEATGLAKEAIYRVNDAQKNLDEIRSGWFRCGPVKPKDACYFGHATFCGQECYVWVCRDGLDDLEKFTRKVLKLGTTLKDVQVVTAPSGIQFAPALTNPGR